MSDEKQRATLSGRPPESPDVPGAPAPIDPATGQHRDYYVLPDEERAKGFVRPVRTSCTHTVCGTVTTMPRPIAETYARAGERRARLRAAREGARRTTLGANWVAHQDQRQAARQLRDGGR